MSVRLSEMTFKRVYDALIRRIVDVPDALLWNLPYAHANKMQIRKFKNIHAGERCFILCNGPSLKKLDLSWLKREKTIGMNRIYLLFEELGFDTTYYACSNELVLEQFCNDIIGLQMPKFLNWNRRHLFSQDKNSHFFRISYNLNHWFSNDMTESISGCGTVTYASLQLAYYMGFQEVILIGADHDFVEKGTPCTTEVRTESEDKSHFHPNYFPKGFKWQLPDLYRSEIGYNLARKAYESAGRKIYNATAGGKLEIFERKDYLSFFNGN